MVADSGLLNATVYHKRYHPAVHDFSHKVLYVVLNLKDLKFINTRLFSINHFNFFSVFWENYGFETFQDPEVYVKNTLEKFAINPEIIDTMVLVTMPKILGYAFNPVSFWLCINKQSELIVVLVEVNNTFGERHGYLCFCKDLNPITKDEILTKDKIFHVSPFCDVAGYYEFRFSIDSSKIDIDINYYQDEKLLIATAIKGVKRRFNDKNLSKYFLNLPVMIFKVILLIHYHALRLWIKNVPYFKKPEKPDANIS